MKICKLTAGQVLCKALARRCGPCSVIGGSEPLPSEKTPPPSGFLFIPRRARAWSQKEKHSHVTSSSAHCCLPFHHSSVGWKLPNQHSQLYTLPPPTPQATAPRQLLFNVFYRCCITLKHASGLIYCCHFLLHWKYFSIGRSFLYDT